MGEIDRQPSFRTAGGWKQLPTQVQFTKGLPLGFEIKTADCLVFAAREHVPAVAAEAQVAEGFFRLMKVQQELWRLCLP